MANTHIMIIIDNIAFYLQKSGGVSVVWQELISRLNNDNSFRVEYLEYKNKPINIFYQLINFGSHRIHQCKDLFKGLQRYLPVKISSVKEKHIFHSSYYRYSRNKNAINITTVHDFTYEYFAKGLKAKVHFWQKKMAILHSEYIICISENTKNDLLKFIPQADPSKIHVIYNGVSDDYILLPSNNILSIDPHLICKEYILFVGARDGYKNFDFAVSAISTTRYKLAIVGPQLSQEETNLLNTKLGDNYYYAGRLSNQELNKLYNNAFALIYPSSYEGFGIPVIEAQCAGCPVIAYNSSSIPEIIGNKMLLMNTLNQSEFNRCVLAIEDPEKNNEIISMGVQNAQRFSWDVMYRQVSELYRHALK
ncbi:MAG: glycosyltransferase family 1 protein [Rikenellaceae bacterium]